MIYLMKGKDSRFVAYYAVQAALAGATVICSVVLMLVTQFAGVLLQFSNLALLATLLGAVGFLSWLVAILAIPGLIAAMIVSAISAWNGRFAEIPLYSGWARRIVKLS
jgi:uncharacterized membrane protein